jgi:transcriptional regulator GlxA family with amidase domain
VRQRQAQRRAGGSKGAACAIERLEEAAIRIHELPVDPLPVAGAQRGDGVGDIRGFGDTATRRIAAAILFVRQNFTRPIRVEEMAEVASMSASSFHDHFRTLTAMSPLQYQKHLRLLEARRLMVVQGANVTEAALQVGYESLSQFSREYARMFGAAPKRDSEAMRGLVASS